MFNRKYIFIQGPFSIAMLFYRSVPKNFCKWPFFLGMVKTYLTGFKWVFPWPTQRFGFLKKKLHGWKITEQWLNLDGVDTFRVIFKRWRRERSMTFLLCPADLESCEGRRSEICAVSVAENTANVIWLVDFFHGRHLFHVWKFQERSLWAFRKWKSYRPTSRYKDSSSYLPIFHHKVWLKGPSMGSNLEGRLLSDPTNKFHWCFVDDITL